MIGFAPLEVVAHEEATTSDEDVIHWTCGWEECPGFDLAFCGTADPGELSDKDVNCPKCLKVDEMLEALHVCCPVRMME